MSNLTLFGIEEQIQKRKQELEELEKQLDVAKKEPQDHQLAKELHGMLCNWNHTDGCGWYYEMKDKKDDWTGHAHSDYLKRAQKLICQCKEHGVPIENALTMFKLIRGH